MADHSIPAGPCREWLGIDPQDLRYPRRVLGLLPSETDPLVVLEAAKARITLLRGLAGGPQEAVRRALLERVEAAREEVLADIAAGGRTATARPSAPSRNRPPATAGFAMPPPPPGAARAPAPAEPHPLLPDERLPGEEALPTERARPTVEAPVIAPIRLRTPPPRRREGLPAVWVVGFLCLLSLAGLLGWLTWERSANSRQRRDVARNRSTEDTSAESATDLPAAGETTPSRQSPAGSPRPAPSDGSGSVLDSMIPAVGAVPPPDPVAMSRPANPAAGDTAAGPAVDPPPDSAPPSPTPADPPTPEPDRQPATGEPSATDPAPPAGPEEAAPAGGDDAEMKAGPTASLPGPFDDAAPADGGAPADGAAPADPLTPHLVAARGAMAKLDFVAAAAAVQRAADVARGAEAVTRVEAWQQLLHYARGFIDLRDKALATVESGQEYDIDGRKVAVVEIDADKFIYRASGKNTTVPRDRIPGKIVMAIVTAWLDDTPANELFIGAYHATKPEPDAGKARGCWEAAAALGVDAGPLLGLLDDPVFRPAPVDP
ncbi:MAG: hypothetical protein EBR86_11230 [Planctomycetia bacterium]|nr:hypothetical protein [Planctomycetia bacterium]